MIAYDADFDPPALVLPIIVTGGVRQRPRLELSALIDSGADVTAVPEAFAERLRLYPIGRLNLEGASGIRRLVYTYDAFLTLAGEPAKRLEVILTPFRFVILGRDWLRDYYVLLDGPGQQFQISSDPLLLEST